MDIKPIRSMYPSNLFRPGDGDLPPYLAGRNRELEAVEPMAADLRAKRSPSANVILYGPRGNGKTVLLKVIGDRMQQAGAAVVQATAKGAAASREALEKALAPYDGWHGAVRRLSEQSGVSLSRLSLFGVKLDLDRSPGPSVEQMLATRCAAGPLALLVDEAHVLDPEMGGGLLDASQSIRGKGAPFLLVLAGTPGIQHALQAMETSHWERSRRVPVGRLDPGEDRAALMRPLGELGVEADEDALVRVLETADRYPYFLQEVGHAIVMALNRNGARRVDDAVAKRTLESFGPIKNAFYGSRIDELDDAELLEYAAAAAREFVNAKDKKMERLQLVNALAAAPDGSGAKAREALRGLVARGVVWPKDGGYEPGIPSLLAHLAMVATPGGPAPPAE